MKLQLSLRQPYRSPELVLKRHAIHNVVTTVLTELDIDQPCSLGIACVDEPTSQQLNLTYRHKDKPTNVLSFPAELPSHLIELLDERPLGDLVICIPVLLIEAQQQHKRAEAHFTHLLVHGVLHLLGYDHELGEMQATEMENLEIKILNHLGINNPYLIEE